MPYIDKDEARRLVKRYWPHFEKSIAAGRDYTAQIKDTVGWLYLILLSIKCITIGALWLGLNYLDPTLGLGYLLVIALVQTKKALDHEFYGVEDTIIEAVKEEKNCRALVDGREEDNSKEAEEDHSATAT